MKPEEKDLLLKDLCARLPYGVKGKVYAEVTNGQYDMNGEMIFYDAPFDVILDGINTSTEEIHVVAIGNEDTVEFLEMQQTDGVPYTVDDFKPYLRPMSSMTEEEKKDIFQLLNIHGDIDNEGDLLLGVEYGIITLKVCKKYLGELNKRMFDVCHMIEKGLALEAPEGMYKS